MRVLIADKMDPVAADIFNQRGITVDVHPGLGSEELVRLIGDYEGVAVRSSTKIGADVLAKPGRLRVIGRAGIGVDTIDVPAATRAGVVVMNTPFGNSVTTAEHTIAMLLALARQIPQANVSTHAGKWEKSAFLGVEVCGKTLGIIGCGNIGGIVATRARGLMMNVMGYDPYLTPERGTELGIAPATLEEIYRSADFITVHTPMTEQTRGLINGAAFARMKKGVRILNVARGGLIVEADLVKALDDGIVAGAALDVFEIEPATNNPLFGRTNVICTPHLGASTIEAQVNVACQIAEQISDFLLTGAVINAVNMPAISAVDAPRLKPYMALVTQLGALAAQLIEGPIKKLTLIYQGQAAELNTKPLTAAATATVLATMSTSINMVNAPEIAKQNGIAIEETRLDPPANLMTAIRLMVTTGSGVVDVMGTLFANGQPRLIAIDGVDIEAPLTPHMILIRNRDQPGMIGALGTLLAEHHINIADFRLGRVSQGGAAVALIAVDGLVPDQVMDKIARIPQVQMARQLVLAV